MRKNRLSSREGYSCRNDPDRSRSVPGGTGLRIAVARGLGAVTLLTVIGANAAESVTPITPPGSTDVDQAFLPPVPGFYGGIGILPLDQNSKTYDSHGRPVPAAENLRITSQLYVAALFYVYPFTILGGNVASSWVQPVQNLTYSIGAANSTNHFGLADAYSDVFYWTKNIGLAGATVGHLPISYGLTLGAGVASTVPDGDYDTKRAVNPGGHTWAVVPNIALTYNSGSRFSFADNTQASVRVFYGIPFRNSTTHYTSGNILDIDWSLTEQFGNLRAGAAGVYQAQVTDDNTGTGASLPNGNRYRYSMVGPIIEYFVPSMKMFIKAKYLYTFYHQNFLNIQALVLTVGMKF